MPDDRHADGEKTMTLGEHLEQLRRRIVYALIGLVIAMAASLFYGRELVALLRLSFDQVVAEAGGDARLAVLSVHAGLVAYLRVGLYAGLVLASPWVILQAWLFVAAGLKPKEKRYVTLAVPASAALFLGGAAFFLLVVSVPILKFLIAVSRWLGFELVVTIDSHISFMTRMMFVFGLAFQTPLVVMLLAKMHLVSVRALSHYRRHVIVVLLALAAVLTPPDVFSQLALGVPMWLLYELGVLLAWLSTREEPARP